MKSQHLQLPRVALGTWAWGDSGELGNGYFGSNFSQDGLDEIINKAHIAHFNLWDTAVVYGMGQSESVLSEKLKSFPRESYMLSTKFTPQVAGEGDSPVAEMLEGSLSRLGVEYIDLYWIHNPADVARWTPQLIPLLESGKVKHVGVSNHNLSQIKMADQILREGGFQVDAVQNHYSLLYRDAENAGILDYCKESGIPFFAYMVLEQGALSGKYSPENPMPQAAGAAQGYKGLNRAQAYNSKLSGMMILIRKLASVAGEKGANIPDVAIAWALAKGALPIVGVTKPQHVEGLVRASNLVLTHSEIAELEEVANAANVDTRGWWEQTI